MIILTERLGLIASNINTGEKVADIGTDHGYLPLYLYEKGISPHVILTDISKGSLNKAKDNSERLFPETKFDFREGDGLEPLNYGEVDVVVLAGIGGLLTIDILEWDIAKTLSFKKLILQPRNNGGELRRYLYQRGFVIDKYLLVPEEKRLCEIMVVSHPDPYDGVKTDFDISEEEFDFPDELSKGETGHERAYLLNALEVENKILAKISEGIGDNPSGKSTSDIDYRKRRIARLEKLLSRMN